MRNQQSDTQKVIQRFMRRFWSKVKAENRPRQIQDAELLRRLPADHIKAAQGLTDKPTMQTVAYLDRVYRATRDKSHPDIVLFYQSLQKEFRRRNYPFYAFEFYRTDERSRLLKAQGRSKAGPGQSPHNYGCAVDIVHATRFWDLTRKEWAVIGAIGKEVARKRGFKLVWGGDWKFYDPAHWELEDWRDYRKSEMQFVQSNETRPERDGVYFAQLKELTKAR